ncbi:MAG: proline racemase family protein [Stappiaceae bacterium]
MSEKEKKNRIKVLDMHTGGEPLRIVTDGYPDIDGSSILEKRRFAKEKLDHLRLFIMAEPRGHRDMYGAVLVKTENSDADIGVLFMHNEGYSTMCGHGIIALGRYVVDHELVEVSEPETKVVFDCPCGLVETTIKVTGGKAGAVSFKSVPSFVYSLDHLVRVPGLGDIAIDVAYGGAFYAIVDASRFKLDVMRAPSRLLLDAADTISRTVRNTLSVEHPLDADLSYLYGTILTDGKDEFSADQPTGNVCVFADGQIDRSPTGSGVSARLAVQHARGQIALHQVRRFKSATDAEFTGKIIEETECGKYLAVVTEISGRANYVGESTFWLDENDNLGKGFLLR